jgi:hypothetical protein
VTPSDPNRNGSNGSNGKKSNGAHEPEDAEASLDKTAETAHSGEPGHEDEERDTMVDLEVAEPPTDVDIDSEPEPALAPPPPEVAELSAACVRFVTTKYKVPLDFTPDTLSLVDQYVRDARGELMVKPEAADLVAASVGAYLGEVLRRAFGATWFCQGEHAAWRLDFKYVFLTFNPIGMAREALMLGEAEGWHAHLETDPGETEFLEERLKTLGEIDEEEFYAPTTRFDVVEIAVDTLRAKMEADGNGDVTFGEDDYRQR